MAKSCGPRFVLHGEEYPEIWPTCRHGRTADRPCPECVEAYGPAVVIDVDTGESFPPRVPMR